MRVFIRKDEKVCYNVPMSNGFKTAILLGSLTGLILAIGYYFAGQDGLFLAVVISAALNFVSFWFSDRIVLSIYRAKEITPEADPSLHREVAALAQAASLPMPRLYLIDMAVPNAFATGRNEQKAVVAVTTGLLQLLDEQERRGVLAHELAHIKHRDILISSIAATLAGAVSYLAQLAYFAGMFGGGAKRDDSGNNMFSMLALVILAPLIATILHLAVSRSREYLADEGGARIAGDPRGLASALRKLHQYSRVRPLTAEPKYESSAHLFIVNPLQKSLLMSIFSTHPPVEERIRRLEQWHP